MKTLVLTARCAQAQPFLIPCLRALFPDCRILLADDRRSGALEEAATDPSKAFGPCLTEFSCAPHKT